MCLNWFKKGIFWHYKDLTKKEWLWKYIELFLASFMQLYVMQSFRIHIRTCLSKNWPKLINMISPKPSLGFMMTNIFQRISVSWLHSSIVSDADITFFVVSIYHFRSFPNYDDYCFLFKLGNVKCHHDIIIPLNMTLSRTNCDWLLHI